MVNIDEFKRNAHELVDWIADYLTNVDKFPVRSQMNYGEIKKSLPKEAPVNPEPMDAIFNDFREKILPGITHWQSPKFFAYFPSNSSTPSVLAEFIVAALGVQGMKWITSPAATELEEVVMEWLRKMINLPEIFSGVIMDTASVATLCAIIAAREKITRFHSNTNGMESKNLRIYCSGEAHSSIEKAVRIAGLGSKNLKKIEVDQECRMVPEELRKAILQDIQLGYIPTCVVAAFGTTGTSSLDPVEEIGKIAKEFKIWLHVDAAFAGTALILPEFRKNIRGLELADSFVFNPHKWMFTNFDCSVFFVRDKEHLQDVFRLVPSYLQTQTNTEANDYSNWGIHLGRRFRALKLWFVIRNFGLIGIQERLREHLALSEYFEKEIRKSGSFELIVPRNLAITCFRFKPKGIDDEAELNRLNAELIEKINSSGRIYISHTIIRGKFTLRFVCAQTNTQKEHVEEAINTITKFAAELI